MDLVFVVAVSGWAVAIVACALAYVNASRCEHEIEELKGRLDRARNVIKKVRRAVHIEEGYKQ